MTKLVLLIAVLAGLAVCSKAKPLDKRPLMEVVFNGKVNHVPEPAKVDPFGRRVPADEGFSRHAYQTDMMLNPEQKEFLHESENDRQKRKAMRDTVYYWPKKVVPYEFSESSSQEIPFIEAALAHWQSLTCLSFQPYTVKLAAELEHNQRLQFVKEDGCWSYVGMQPDTRAETTPQHISIGEGCTERGTISHEIGHAIGFQHEQARPDRDEHVDIDWNNIDPKQQHNFEMMSLGEVYSKETIEYDPRSVMHYGAYGFAIDPSVPTLLTKDPTQMPYIGQRDGLSFLDAKLANIIYRCAEHCTNGLSCLNGGYVDKNCDCACPKGWSGDVCEVEVAVEEDVESVTLTDESGIIESPNYPTDDTYPVNKGKLYYIKGEPGSKITVEFGAFNLESYDTKRAKCWDYVQINIDDPRYGGEKYCGSASPGVIEAMDELAIWFYSDETTTAEGFRASYTIQAPIKPTEKTATTKAQPTEAATTAVQPTEAATTKAQPTKAATPTVRPTEAATTKAQPTEAAKTTAQPTKAATTKAQIIKVAATTAQPTKAATTKAQPTKPATTTTQPTKAAATTKQPTTTTTEPMQCSKIFTSPNYPDEYSSDTHIAHKMTSPAGTRLLLTIVHLDIEESPQAGECEYDSLSIDLGYSAPKKLCGSTPSNTETFLSLSNTMNIVFRSDAYVEQTGFMICVNVVQQPTGSCGGEFDEDWGTLASPNYPNSYPNSATCTYTIEVDENELVELTFLSVDIESDPTNGCSYDCLTTDLGTSTFNLEGTMGRLQPIVSQSNKVTLTFTTDAFVYETGFSLFYRAIPNPALN